jgi:putative flippase GtrA
MTAHDVFLFVKYTLVATLGLVCDMAMLYSLVEFAHMSVLYATATSYIAATVIAFFLHKKLTFHDHSNGVGKQFTSFFIISTINFILTILIMHVFIDILHIWYMISKFITATILLFLSYGLNRIWTFREGKK